ncbi:DUF5703 family protein [Rothia sp. LK2588]
MITSQPGEKVSEVRSRLGEHTEYGRWELARSVILYGGKRRFWLRRKILRVRNTAGVL